MFTAFLGCSSDSDSETSCPLGYTGSNCDMEKVPTKMFISKIRVTSFPNQNNTSDWDVGSAPDIFVRLGRGTGDANTVTLYTSNYFENVLSTGTDTYDFVPVTPIEILSPTQTHLIVLGDYDSVSANELMGGYTFTPYENGMDFPTEMDVYTAGSLLRFKLYVSYQW